LARCGPDQYSSWPTEMNAARPCGWGLERAGRLHGFPIVVAVPPPARTKWTRRVPHPVLIGHTLPQILFGLNAEGGRVHMTGAHMTWQH
jgi:hypothetical protein